MSIKNILCAILVLFVLTGCNREWFTTHSGNMPTNDRIEKLQFGQTQKEVISLLGTPSNVVSLDRDTWIYMSAEVERIAFFKPKEVSRDVLLIKFSDYKVTEIKRMTEKDGEKIIVSTDKTETLGHNPGFFAKFFGGSKTFSPIAPGAGM